MIRVRTNRKLVMLKISPELEGKLKKCAIKKGISVTRLLNIINNLYGGLREEVIREYLWVSD